MKRLIISILIVLLLVATPFVYSDSSSDSCLGLPNLDLNGVTDDGYMLITASTSGNSIPNNQFYFALCDPITFCTRLYNASTCAPLPGCETAILCGQTVLDNHVVYYTVIDKNEASEFLVHQLNGAAVITFAKNKIIPVLSTNTTFQVYLQLSQIFGYNILINPMFSLDPAKFSLQVRSTAIKFKHPPANNDSLSSGYITAIVFSCIFGTLFLIVLFLFWKKVYQNKGYGQRREYGVEETSSL